MTPTPHSENSTPQSSGPADLWQALERLMRKEGWLLLGLLVGLGLAELVVRQVRPDFAGLTYGAALTGGHPIEITQDGLRVAPGTTSDAHDTRSGPVVLALGDSTTFGTGVGIAQTWPQALAPALPSSVVLHNAGFPGASLENITARYQTIWAPQDPPDVVVLLVTANLISFTDFHWGTNARPPQAAPFPTDTPGVKTRIKYVAQSSALWKAVSVHVTSFQYAVGLALHQVDPLRPLSPLMAYGWVQPDLDVQTQTRMWQRFETSLQALRQDVQDSGSCLVIGYLPPRFAIGPSRLDNLKFVPLDRLTTNPEDRVRDLATQLDLPFIDAGAALRATRAQAGPWRAPLYIPGDYTHLSAQGHEIVATAAAATLAPLLAGTTTCTGAP